MPTYRDDFAPECTYAPLRYDGDMSGPGRWVTLHTDAGAPVGTLWINEAGDGLQLEDVENADGDQATWVVHVLLANRAENYPGHDLFDWLVDHYGAAAGVQSGSLDDLKHAQPWYQMWLAAHPA